MSNLVIKFLVYTIRYKFKKKKFKIFAYTRIYYPTLEQDTSSEYPIQLFKQDTSSEYPIRLFKQDTSSEYPIQLFEYYTGCVDFKYYLKYVYILYTEQSFIFIIVFIMEYMYAPYKAGKCKKINFGNLG